jgi:hypothetical protein
MDDSNLLATSSSNLLLSLLGVQQPSEDPSVDSSSTPELKEFSSLLCLSAHFLDALLAEYLSPQNVQQFWVPSVHPLHLLNALLAELSESSVILVFFFNSQQSSSSSTSCLCSMPTWQSSLQNLQQSSVCNCVLSYTALPPRYSTTLRSSSPELLIQSCASARLCLTPQSSEVHPLCTALRTRSVLSHPPGMKPQRPST